MAAVLVAMAGVVVPRGGSPADGAATAGRVESAPPALVVHGGGLDLAWSETGYVAGGLVVVLGTLRQHRLRTSSRHVRRSPPSEATQRLEQHLRTSATTNWELVNKCWQSAAAHAPSGECSQPLALVVSNNGVVEVIRGDRKWATADAGSSMLVQLGRTVDGALFIPHRRAARLEVRGPEHETAVIRRSLELGVRLVDPWVEQSGNGEDDSRAAWCLTKRLDDWIVEPLGLSIRPTGLDTEGWQHVSRLLDSVLTADSDEVTTIDLPLDSPSSTDETPEFVVRLLGPVELTDRDGRVVPVERRKSLELLAWLTTHRQHAARDGARTALWEHDISDASFTNVVSEARRVLRRHLPPPAGTEWLGRSATGLLRLHHAVANDVDLFRRHLLAARRSEGAARRDRLRAALGLVRGVPFGAVAYSWADAEALTTNLTMLIVDTAYELGERDLEAGHFADALDSTSIGLAVLPGHEELVGLRLRIRARAGDLAGLHHEWRSYERSLATDPWQTEPADWLADLHRGLAIGAAVG